MKHIFVFTSYDWDRHIIDEVCYCNHDVSPEEWEEHCKMYEKKLKNLREGSYIAYGKRTGEGHREVNGWGTVVTIRPASNSYYDSPEDKQVNKWIAGNCPRESFKKLHNMRETDFSEFCLDCD